MVKKLCRLNQVRKSVSFPLHLFLHLVQKPYKRYLCEQFRIAFDVYLEILHHVDTLVNSALKRDTPDWRVKNCCPPCMYTLEDEPPLKYKILLCMDGNTSLKLLDPAILRGQPRVDPRTFRTSYWIPEEEVNKFADEVTHMAPADAQDADTEAAKRRDEETAWVDEDGVFADDDSPQDDATTDGMVQTTCVQRWKNAAPEARKKMFAVFDASGVFITLCRHGLLLLICDMVRSGEL